jgi:hypothetical protein
MQSARRRASWCVSLLSACSWRDPCESWLGWAGGGLWNAAYYFGNTLATSFGESRVRGGHGGGHYCSTLPVPQRNASLESKLNFSLAIRNLGADHEATTCVQYKGVSRHCRSADCQQHSLRHIDSFPAQSEKPFLLIHLPPNDTS